jgi:pimeloyl-[acyl-carrier protein] methyl ester esterase
MIAIVLLPGMDGTGFLFDDFANALGLEFEPIVVSYPPEVILNYKALEAFARTHLPLDRPFIILGESFSGPIAIALAASNPVGLIGLVLSCTFAKNPHPYLRSFKSLIRFLPVSAKTLSILSPLFFGNHATPKLRKSLQNAMSHVSKNVLRARLGAVLEIDCSAELRRLSVPLLYLRATNDRIVFSSAYHYISSLVPTATKIDIDGPHLLLQSMPDAAADAVKRFVTR